MFASRDKSARLNLNHIQNKSITMPLEKDKDATIVVKDTPDQEKYEFLKEKIRYKQALRENSKKIDHQKVRLNIQADAHIY